MAEQPQTKDDVLRIVRDRGIEFVFFQYVELYGKPCAKLVPAQALSDLWDDGAGAAGFAAGEIGQGPHDPDVMAFPDPKTFVQLPWQKDVGLLQCNVYVDDEPWPYDPRRILQLVLERAKKKGYTVNVGLEPEFMLLEEGTTPDRETGPIQCADPLDNLVRPCYDVKGITRQYDFIRELSKCLNELGWGNYALDHEDANGQFEANIEYADALTTADRAVVYKYAVETLARKHGMMATFMPKPFEAQTGNGLHVSLSLWDDKNQKNLFEDPNDPRGIGLSETGYHFAGGLLEHAKAYIGVTAPTVNSYKRLIRGTPTRRTWVPVFVSYGGNNRTQMLRCTPGKIEDRTPDFSGNPYLALAAIVASGLDGIERRIDPGEYNTDNLYEISDEELKRRGVERLPGNMLDAIRNLEQDEVLREAFGMAKNEHYLDYYCRVKRDDWDRFHTSVTEWEHREQLFFP